MSKLFPRFGAAIDDHNFISRDNQKSTNFPQLTVFRDAQNFHRSDRSGKIKKSPLVFVCCQGCPSFLRNSHAFQGCAKFHCMVLGVSKISPYFLGRRQEWPKFRRGILAEFRVSKILWQFLARRKGYPKFPCNGLRMSKILMHISTEFQGCPAQNFTIIFHSSQGVPKISQRWIKGAQDFIEYSQCISGVSKISLWWIKGVQDFVGYFQSISGVSKISQ